MRRKESNMKITSIVVEQNTFKQIRKLLLDRDKTFSEWLREKMQEEIDKQHIKNC